MILTHIKLNSFIMLINRKCNTSSCYGNVTYKKCPALPPENGKIANSNYRVSNFVNFRRFKFKFRRLSLFVDCHFSSIVIFRRLFRFSNVSPFYHDNFAFPTKDFAGHAAFSLIIILDHHPPWCILQRFLSVRYSIIITNCDSQKNQIPHDINNNQPENSLAQLSDQK